jgi:UPF0042 nucleotide-binding protein
LSATDNPASAERAPLGARRPGERQRLVLITGLSGSGKTTVARSFEDLGYTVVDNLPLGLLRPLLADPRAYVEPGKALAVVADARVQGLADELPGLWRGLDRTRVDPTLLFLEASVDNLQRRFSETRRPHPMAPAASVLEGVARERAALGELRGLADLVFDTTDWSSHDTRAHVFREFGGDRPQPGLALSLVSFGFKHGTPPGTDLLFDVRFLPNPYFVPELRERSGLEPPVRSWLERVAEYGELVARLDELLRFLLPLYQRENRSYLSIGIGCTGGRHRSIAVAEALAARLAAGGWSARVLHRDIERA